MWLLLLHIDRFNVSHLAGELHDLLVIVEVDPDLQVGVAAALGEIVLVLPDHVGAGLASD